MKIPAGATAYIGPPAKPIPQQISDAIGTKLGKISEILEAHLPNVYVQGHIDPPAQVLVVVLEEGKPSPHSRISEILDAVLPTDSHMNIMEWHLDHPTLPTVWATHTELNLKRKLN